VSYSVLLVFSLVPMNLLLRALFILHSKPGIFPRSSDLNGLIMDSTGSLRWLPVSSKYCSRVGLGVLYERKSGTDG